MVLPEGGQRRSARLQALEEQKAASAAASATDDALQPSNAAQTSTRKRGRKKKVREVCEITHLLPSFSNWFGICRKNLQR